MRKRESDRIEKLFSDKENSVNVKKAISACKKFSGCSIIGTNEKSIACPKCKGIQKEICDYIAKNTPVKKSRSERPWELIVSDLYNDIPRKKIVEKCIKLGMKESASKDFVSSAGCVVNTVKGKNKKNGLVSQYINYLKKGKKGKEPEGSKNLIYYCKQVFNTCMNNESISKDLLNTK